jgi:hypothetical protein
MIPILNKWSTKIQAASIQVSGKQGSSKFLQSTKGNMGIIEAIEAGVASKVGYIFPVTNGQAEWEYSETAIRHFLRVRKPATERYYEKSLKLDRELRDQGLI